MKKKLVSVLLATAMTASLFAGCGSKGGNQTADTEKETTAAENNEGGDAETEAEKPAATGKVETIKVYIPTSGKFDDLDKVMAKVNEITVPEIGVEVEFHAYEFGQWFQQYSLFLSGTEDIDIMANYGGYLNGVSQGACYDMSELLQEYGQDIVAMEGDFLKGGEIDGAQYAIPIYASYSWNMGIIYRQDVVDELGLTEQAAAAKTLEDWEPILQAVKDAKPEMTPFVASNGNGATNMKYGLWDDLGNVYGVLMDPTGSSTVENLFETQEYADLCKEFNVWYNKGYASKDIQTQTDPFPVLTRNDAAFCTVGQVDFNTSFYQSTTCGKPMGVVALGEPVARTYNNVTYTMMSNTKHPEACMKFMNLWFSDKDLGTLISYGIEGEHYVIDENGMGTYPEGQDASSCKYHLGAGISNINRITWCTENPDYAELLVENNNNAAKSVALGFSFNTDNVTNEITQLNNVCSKYQVGLECGALDPETTLPQFIQELKDAGIDTVIAEKQAQLDAFLGN